MCSDCKPHCLSFTDTPQIVKCHDDLWGWLTIKEFGLHDTDYQAHDQAHELLCMGVAVQCMWSNRAMSAISPYGAFQNCAVVLISLTVWPLHAGTTAVVLLHRWGVFQAPDPLFFLILLLIHTCPTAINLQVPNPCSIPSVLSIHKSDCSSCIQLATTVANDC